MSANELLLWMSARGSGTWQQFRAAVEELHLAAPASATGEDDEVEDRSFPLHHDLRLNFERLGHAEFFGGANGSDWRVTPPSLSMVQRREYCLGVVAGARSAKLLNRLYSASASLDIETTQFPACPDQIRLKARDMEELTAAADRAGMLTQADAPTAILASLPPVDNESLRKTDDLPFGTDWRIEQFSTTTLSWRTAPRERATSTSVGLFRFSFRHRKHVLLCLRGRSYAISTQVGKYYVLHGRKKTVLFYDAASGRLSVAASCRPPFLIERALILYSGLPPSYEKRPSRVGLLHYSDIPRNTANLVFALLRQGLP